jgi:hypothetical protein
VWQHYFDRPTPALSRAAGSFGKARRATARDGAENSHQLSGRASGVVLQRAVGPGIGATTGGIVSVATVLASELKGNIVTVVRGLIRFINHILTTRSCS